jgi:hypothetical protein
MTTFGTTRIVIGPLGAVQLDRGCAGLLTLLLKNRLAGATRDACIEAIGYRGPESTPAAWKCLDVRLCHLRRALREVGSTWRIRRIAGEGMVLHLGAASRRPA